LWYLGGSFGNPAAEWLLGLTLVVIVVRAALRRPRSGFALAAALVAVLAWAQSIFTVSGLFPTHFAILIPFCPMLIALGADGLLAELPRPQPESRAPSGPVRLAAGALVLAGLGGSLARDAWVDVEYHRALERTGGLNAHSDAVYALAEYLDGLPAPGPVLALDWGYAPAVRFLTAGRVAPLEVFGYSWEPDAEFEARLAPSLEAGNALYVAHWPQETIFPRRLAFEAALAARGLRGVTQQTFSRRDGAPIFDVIRLEPGP
jgi:hypothetical protein